MVDNWPLAWRNLPILSRNRALSLPLGPWRGRLGSLDVIYKWNSNEITKPKATHSLIFDLGPLLTGQPHRDARMTQKQRCICNSLVNITTWSLERDGLYVYLVYLVGC